MYWRDQLYRWLGDYLVLSGTVGQLVFLLGVNAVVVWRLWLSRGSRDIGTVIKVLLTALTITASVLYMKALWD